MHCVYKCLSLNKNDFAKKSNSKEDLQRVKAPLKLDFCMKVIVYENIFRDYYKKD